MGLSRDYGVQNGFNFRGAALKLVSIAPRVSLMVVARSRVVAMELCRPYPHSPGLNLSGLIDPPRIVAP